MRGNWHNIIIRFGNIVGRVICGWYLRGWILIWMLVIISTNYDTHKYIYIYIIYTVYTVSIYLNELCELGQFDSSQKAYTQKTRK